MTEHSALKKLQYDNPVMMAQVVAGLVQGRSVQDVCQTIGIDRNRVTRWYRESDEFRELLDDTTDAVIAAIRGEVVAETADRMAELLPAAVQALEDALESDKTSERVTAAAHIMRFSGYGAKKEAPRPSVRPEEMIRGTDGPAAGD